jgi:hypothetical protein
VLIPFPSDLPGGVYLTVNSGPSGEEEFALAETILEAVVEKWRAVVGRVASPRADWRDL